MSNSFLVVASLLVTCRLFAQEIKVDVGDAIPSFKLEKVFDNKGNLSDSYKAKKNISDFKGKLVILDFWNSGCSPCVKGFSKMAQLQEKYKDKIQIFLVNSWENEEWVKNWIIERNKKKTNLLRFPIVVPDLPILIDSKEILNYFKTVDVGDHVWIDQQGIVQLHGIPANTHEKKIDEFLSGKKVSFVKDNSFRGLFEKPYFISASVPSPLYSSSFGAFDDVNANPYGAGAEDFIDSVAGTRRNTLLNFTIEQILRRALGNIFKQNRRILYGNRFLFEINDISLVTEDKTFLKLTDEDFLKKLCYEQIVPLGMNDSVSKQLMLEDIQRYLLQRYGFVGTLEKRVVNCFKLKYNGDINRLKSKETVPRSLYYKDHEPLLEGFTLFDFFSDYFSPMDREDAHFQIRDLIVNDTGIDPNERIDISLLDLYTIQSVDELIKYLKTKDFDLVRDTAEVEMFTIKLGSY